MSDEALCALAREAGIAVEWTDVADHRQIVSPDVLRRLLSILGLGSATSQQIAESRAQLRAPTKLPPLITATVGSPCRVPGGKGELRLESGEVVAIREGEVPAIRQPGYHTLRLGNREIALAVAPARCVTLTDIADGKAMYGLAVQTYALRREGDGGIGDTTSLSQLAQDAAGQGADALAISPAHSLFPGEPARRSPYSPSSRLFLNPLLADPACVFGAARVRGAGAGLSIPDSALIDWPAASQHKRALLRNLFDVFATHDLAQGNALAQDFRRFVEHGGQRLIEHARFEAKGNDVDYALFEQWIADRAFAGVQRTAREAGMRIGLIADLAIGLDRGGSQAQSRPHDMLDGVSVGAPPDPFNARGQDWGLAAFSPHALVNSGFEPFLATLRAALHHAGGVRIDHAMGLMRLWLIPDGHLPTEGAYLAYPLDDLLRLVALESHRHRAIVIGEDLGTVPPEFRARCRDAGIAGMDVLWFQHEDGTFRSPRQWRRDAVAMTTTHDLPTVAGWWQGADIALRGELGLASDTQQQREQDRTALWRACVEAGVAKGAAPSSQAPQPAVDAALALVGVAPTPLVIAPLEDVLGLAEQPNVPGTIDEHPNWRRRFEPTTAALLQPAPVRARLKRLAERAP